MDGFFIVLCSVLGYTSSYLWIALRTERRLKEIYKKKVDATWRSHEALLHANIELHEKLIRIRAVLGSGK